LLKEESGKTKKLFRKDNQCYNYIANTVIYFSPVDNMFLTATKGADLVQ